MDKRQLRWPAMVAIVIAASAPRDDGALAQTPAPTGPAAAPAPAPAAAPAAAAAAAADAAKPAATDDAKMTEARERYNRGIHLFEDKNYDAASVEFARAYELSPKYNILYNIGVCAAQLNDYVSAIANLQKFLTQGGDNIPAARRAEVESVLADIRPRIAHLTVQTNTDGASVSVDDVVVGVTPLPGPVDVNPGRRKISANKQGRFPVTRSVVLAGSEAVTVKLDLDAPPESAPGPQAKGPNVLPYVLWGGTAALAIGAGITGIVALNTSSDLKNADNTLGSTSQSREDSRSKMRTFAVTADILTVSAVVVGGAALYFTLHKSKDRQAPAASASSVKSLELGVRPTGAVLTGTF